MLIAYEQLLFLPDACVDRAAKIGKCEKCEWRHSSLITLIKTEVNSFLKGVMAGAFHQFFFIIVAPNILLVRLIPYFIPWFECYVNLL